MRDLRGSSATTPEAATATSGAVAGPGPARESRCATPCPAARPACSRTRRRRGDPRSERDRLRDDGGLPRPGGQRQPRPDRACPAGPALRRAAADALDANARTGAVRRGRRSASSAANDPARGSGGAYARFREGVRPWNAGCLRCADCDPACRHSGCAISDPYRGATFERGVARATTDPGTAHGENGFSCHEPTRAGWRPPHRSGRPRPRQKENRGGAPRRGRAPRDTIADA